MLTRIRVCHCIENLYACGAQQVVHHVVTNLDHRRFDPIVYSFHDGPLRELIETAGVPVRIIQRRLPKLDPGLVRHVRAALRQDEIDILHMHLFGADLHGTLAAAYSSIRKVVTLHSPYEDNAWQRLGYAGIFRAADVVVAVSQHARDCMTRRYGRLRRKAIVIPNGVDLARFAVGRTKDAIRRTLGLPIGAPLVGTIGRLNRQKGHETLLRAFAQMKARVPDAQLVLVGEGELHDHLQRIAARLGVTGVVRFLGSRSDVPELLAALDVFVLSSLWEGLPLVLLEAMAAGTPIVATNVGGVREVLNDGTEAMVVRAGDADSLAHAMGRLVTDPVTAMRLCKNALARVRDDFNVQKMVREHETLYFRLLPDRVRMVA